MNAYLTKSSLLGTVSLGLLAAACAMGCGGSTSGKANAGDGTGNPEKVQITQQSWVAAGCGVTGTYGIWAPQTLEWIAANNTFSNNFNLSLQQIDQFGNQFAVNQTAQQASSSMQSMINSLISNSSAAQQFAQFSNNNMAQRSSVASTSTNEVVQTATSQNGFNETITDTAMSASQAHQDSHSASQQASAQNSANNSNFSNASSAANANQSASANQNAFGHNNSSAANDNVASANQAAGNNFFNNLWNGGTGFTGVCGGVCSGFGGFWGPVTNSGSNNSWANTNTVNENFANAFNNWNNGANTNQFVNSNQFANSHANNANSSNAASAQQSSAQSANAYADQIANASHTAVVNQIHNDTATTQQRALNTTTAVNDVAANSANGMQNASSAAQNTATNSQNSSSAASSQSSALVYNNLSYNNASHYLVEVQANLSQANSQQAFQLFAGTVGGLTGVGVYPYSVPAGCY